MARPASYNCHDVLQAATLLFWEKGYRAVSVADLVKVTGLQPGSLYGRFGSKEGLFVECLEHYRVITDEERSAFDEVASPLGRLRSFYDALVDQATSPEGERGCFVVNSALECGAGEATPVRSKVQDCMAHGEAWLRRQLQAALASGELRPEADPALVAGCLVNSLYGFRVMARAQEGQERLRAIADATFASLVGPWMTAPALGRVWESQRAIAGNAASGGQGGAEGTVPEGTVPRRQRRPPLAPSQPGG